MPVDIRCAYCLPEVKQETDDDGNIIQETVSYKCFENWIDYAKHIIASHGKEQRAIWAKNCLSTLKNK